MRRLLIFIAFVAVAVCGKAQSFDSGASHLKGKIINVIGDSYVRNHRRPFTEAWHSLVAERNGMVYRNYGRNGNCIVFDREKEGWGKPMLERYKEMNDTADYVLVIAGHNDAFKIGGNADSLRIFRNGLRQFCKCLIEKYPKAVIAFVTPWDVPHDGFPQTIRAISEVCAEYSIPCLNAANTGGINVGNAGFRKQFFQGPKDTAHLNAKGHELFYPTGFHFISRLKPRRSTEEAFRQPSEEAKPLMIWQWMDGMVNEKAITADLEAYKEAGIGGVQQFLVGGEVQTLICDSANAIGTENWRRQMGFAISECKRLGLSFGTHNCPGWSSSAFPTVKPEDSMQKIVWSMARSKGGRVELPQPEVDAKYNYYKDIAVIAMPDADTVSPESVIVVDGGVLPKGDWRVYRFGHTTNGKTNYATAPMGGVGLECDKMSREALDRYWAGYPQMLLELSGNDAGHGAFQRLEIDSYEAGGQEWTKLMPEEFRKRRGYDIRPWLPVIAGVTIGDDAATQRFRKDWRATVEDLFAENYYGYMSELAHRHGLTLIVQPYGTGSSKPFNPINTGKIISRISADDPVCAEFWIKPERWGWPQVPGVVAAARKGGHEIVFAEGFTCWPLHAWKDDPNDLKRVADRSFCLGINSLMLHAGALNPWTDHKPGMTFGQWGTQWTPGQTWWLSGGAKALFGYMARCQALLQRGRFIDDFKSRKQSLSVDELKSGDGAAINAEAIQWTHRRDGDADVFFIANTSESAVSPTVSFNINSRLPEVWNPETEAIGEAENWNIADGKTFVNLNMNAGDALFLIFRNGTESTGKAVSEAKTAGTIALDNKWTVKFPSALVPDALILDTLSSWHESGNNGVKYFSGTAAYTTKVKIKRIDKHSRYILDLGTVKNLATVKINGKDVANLWRPPFRCDITDALHKGNNEIEVSVTNLWVNRLIGDEQEPDDIEWSEPYRFAPTPEAKPAGRFMKSVPDWLRSGKPRPSANRRTVVSFKFYEKDAELLPSGLLGPAVIKVME